MQNKTPDGIIDSGLVALVGYRLFKMDQANYCYSVYEYDIHHLVDVFLTSRHDCCYQTC